ncbi:hypothetical protein HY643_01810 [Candidatus Woesearchaeota archaeon]|nr:hypothetical protein [Candidatus Woesearchaeota archaeon]
MVMPTQKVREIIEKLTKERESVLSEKVFFEAGELGIGETFVQKTIDELKEKNFLFEPMRGVLKLQKQELANQLLQ